MEALTENIKKLYEQMAAFWVGLSAARKFVFVAIILGVATLVTVLLFSQKKEELRYLYTDMSPEDVNEVAGFLRASGNDQFVIDKSGIKVPDSQLGKLRISLAQEGLPSKGVIGWEKFDQEDFTRTEFEQDVQKLRAIQGELSRTISTIEGVASARVHIVIPKNSLFVRNERKPSAAIYLRYKKNAELDKKAIKGIQHLVSKSVEGLEINNITIVDSGGKMLTEAEPDDFTSKLTKELLSYKSKVESDLQLRIMTMVGRVVGPDRVDAKVDAEVDFTQETQTISDIDPDDIAVTSKNTTGFSMEGTGLNPTGVPGSKSNVPGEAQELSANSSKAGSKRDSELVNYEFSKVVSEKTMPVGNIKRLTVSVLIDGKQIYPTDGSTPEFIPRTNEEMEKITELVKNAVGFKKDRDQITIQNMMFQLDQFKMIEISNKSKEDREYFSTLVVSFVIALALTLFFAFIVRPYFRWLSYDPERKAAETTLEEYKPDLELGTMQNVQIQEDVPFEKLSPKEQVIYLARHEPKRTTEALRILLNPHNNS